MRRLRLPRRALVAAAVLLVALAGGYLAVRDSDLVRVERVAVTGTSGPDAPKVEATLKRAAAEMTTLNADADRLREAVARFPTVGDVEVERDLPNDLTIVVLERRAVGLATVGDSQVPVTADGRLLRGATVPRDLPLLALDREPTSRVDDPKGRRLLAALAAAPDALRRRARRAYLGPEGLTVAMREGPSVYLGSTDDLRAKWQAVARVLADPTAEGARYVDVRVPERAAAGGLAPLVEPEAPSEEPAPAAPETVPVPEPDSIPDPPSPSTGA